MPTPLLARALAAAALLASTLGAQAADFSFSGNIVLNTDVVGVGFDVPASAGSVHLWTDSWKDGLNYDPDMALWQRQGSAYVLVAQNDDADVLAAGQGFFDAGLQLSSPAAGHYLVTVGASPNVPLGTLLSQGFGFDPSYGPIAVQPIAQWNQPSYDVNANDQKGSFWRINLSGVENAVALPAVPEPASWMLAIAGLGVIGWVGRRRR